MNTIRLTDLPEILDTPALRRALQDQLQASAADWLGGVSLGVQGGLVDPTDLSISVLGVQIDEQTLNARVGVFFSEVVGGCNCHDDPTRHPGYALFDVTIERTSGRVQARPGSDAS